MILHSMSLVSISLLDFHAHTLSHTYKHTHVYTHTHTHERLEEDDFHIVKQWTSMSQYRISSDTWVCISYCYYLCCYSVKSKFKLST